MAISCNYVCASCSEFVPMGIGDRRWGETYGAESERACIFLGAFSVQMEWT